MRLFGSPLGAALLTAALGMYLDWLMFWSSSFRTRFPYLCFELINMQPLSNFVYCIGPFIALRKFPVFAKGIAWSLVLMVAQEASFEAFKRFAVWLDEWNMYYYFAFQFAARGAILGCAWPLLFGAKAVLGRSLAVSTTVAVVVSLPQAYAGYHLNMSAELDVMSMMIQLFAGAALPIAPAILIERARSKQQNR